MKMVDSERRFVITNENEVNITTPNFNAKFLAPNSYACDFYGDLTRIRSLKKKKMIRLNVIFLKFFRLEIFSFFVVLHVNCKNYYFINNFLLLRILGIQNIFNTTLEEYKAIYLDAISVYITNDDFDGVQVIVFVNK